MKKLLLLIGAMLVLCTTAIAQVTTSSIGGYIYDQGRQPLPGAVIVATHTPTGTVYSTAALNNGRFNIAGMRIGGPYVIEVSFLGYNGEKRENVLLALGEEATLNFALQESAQQIGEVVVVGSNNPVFSANRTGAEEIITSAMMEKLPTVSRSLSSYTKLTPMSSDGNYGGISYRFNNVTVDGASFNNSFGLSSKLGAGGVEPISLESIEQIQVSLSPFDVRNGGFTGGSVNSVTKSGTNDWSASAYMYIKSPDLQGYRQGVQTAGVTDFNNKQYGFSFSGPIIKNKLFFFLNGELDRQDVPNSSWRAKGAEGAGSQASNVTVDQLQAVQDFLGKEFGYNPGSYNVTNRETRGDRLTARLDWNIDARNTLSLKYYYLKSYNTSAPSTSGATGGSRGPNEYSIPFSSTYYRGNNDFNIVMAELNTRINDRMTNSLQAGVSFLRDYRDMDGGFFPQVDLLWANDPGTIMTTFGTEANSYNNQLNTDIYQIQDNLTYTTGKHQITAGISADLRKFKNGFAQNYPGAWEFSSFDSFKFNVLAMKDHMASGGNFYNFNIANYNPTSFGLPAGTSGAPTKYSQRYSVPEDFPFALVDVASVGFYVQDKFSIRENLHLTLGLRADIPIFLTDLDRNQSLEGVVFQGGETIDVSKYPNTRVQLSPRLGINWDVFDDQTLQIRGGAGLFSGTPPYVWLSNQAGGNGMLFGNVNVPQGVTPGFSGGLDYPRPANGTAPVGDIAVTEKNFKYPTIFKGSLAADWNVYDGWILTGEFLYSKNINDIYHLNIGLKDPTDYVRDGSGSNTRPYFGGSSRYISNKANNVILLKNTDKGYSAYTTFKLQKNFAEGVLRGLALNASYTFGQSKSVTDGSSSVAYSAWQYRQAVDPSKPEVGFNGGSFTNRFLAYATYRKEWENTATSIGVIYDRWMGGRYSYAYTGDINGDGATSNDLIFIPKDRSQINLSIAGSKYASLTAYPEGHPNYGQAITTDEQRTQIMWEDIDAFIKQDDYLSKHRGEYAERNGGELPHSSRWDVNVSQDFFFNTTSGKRHTLRISLDIQNLGNLLNKDWGINSYPLLGNPGQQYQFLYVKTAASAANNYTPELQMTNNSAFEPFKRPKTFKDDFSAGSRWSAMFGIKYFF